MYANAKHDIFVENSAFYTQLIIVMDEDTNESSTSKILADNKDKSIKCQNNN